MKNVVVLGGGGFIGGHLSKRLKDNGNNVTICDIKNHEFFNHTEICDNFIKGDLRDPKIVEQVITDGIDEVYQLAADMGGAGYIFTGDNDANVMHNSALINLNVVHECTKKKVGKVFYSSSACMYPEHNQLDPNNPNCEESSAYPANPDSEYGWERSFLYIDECVEATTRLLRSNWSGPVNIGSEEMVTINQLGQMAIDISEKDVKISNIYGQEFIDKYGFKCPLGVRGRNSDNKLYRNKIGWEVSQPLINGMKKTYQWINEQVNNKTYIYESPDKGNTIYRREFGEPPNTREKTK